MAKGMEDTDAGVQLRVARLLLETGRVEDALEHGSTAVRLAPADPEATALLVRIAAALGRSRRAPQSS